MLLDINFIKDDFILTYHNKGMYIFPTREEAWKYKENLCAKNDWMDSDFFMVVTRKEYCEDLDKLYAYMKSNNEVYAMRNNNYFQIIYTKDINNVNDKNQHIKFPAFNSFSFLYNEMMKAETEYEKVFIAKVILDYSEMKIQYDCIDKYYIAD